MFTRASSAGAMAMNLTPAPGVNGGFGPSTVVLDWIVINCYLSGNGVPNFTFLDDGGTFFKEERQNTSGAAGTFTLVRRFPRNGPTSAFTNPRLSVTSSNLTRVEAHVGYHYA
jgi:hypothetical protein